MRKYAIISMVAGGLLTLSANIALADTDSDDTLLYKENSSEVENGHRNKNEDGVRSVRDKNKVKRKGTNSNGRYRTNSNGRYGSSNGGSQGNR